MNAELQFWKTLAILLGLCLLATVVFVGVPGLDIKVSSLFTDENGRFFLARNGFANALRSVFVWTITFSIVFALIMFLGSFYRSNRLKIHRNVWAFACAAFALGPGLLVNGMLKEYWGRARPQQIVEFGGRLDFSSAFQISDQCVQNCSFVSGEGSAAATLAVVLLMLIGRDPHIFARGRASISIIVLAVLCAFLRVAFGRHFASDTIFAILFCTILALLLYRAFQIETHRRQFNLPNIAADFRSGLPFWSDAWKGAVRQVRRLSDAVAARGK
jgi:lipid A 4'-phosphatase